MRTQAANRRGQPLLFLAALILLWIGARLILWENPWPAVSLPGLYRLAPVVSGADADPADRAGLAAPSDNDSLLRGMSASARPVAPKGIPPVTGLAAPTRRGVLQVAPLPTQIRPPAAAPQPSSSVMGLDRVREAPAPRMAARSPAPRWRADAWVHYREGSATLAASPSIPSYGASQAGAIIAYRLSPEFERNPELYARGSKALVENGEIDVAAGVRITPLPTLPVRVHAEMRATRFASETEVRPSAFVTAGIDEEDLIAGVGVRAYAQAGYVGGRYATGFADGHAVAEKQVAELGPARVGIGAGVWGGAQEGAERLDVGPTASAIMDVGGAPVRLSADYRIRVGGAARPGDGVAITLTTGF